MQMVDRRTRTTYYVSDFSNGKLLVIDGESHSPIGEIEIGSRPYNIVIDDKNYAYIASDRNNRIIVVNSTLDILRTWNISNNGNLLVDSKNQRLYVADTEEVCIYNLTSGKLIQKIKEFSAADCIRLDKEKKKLFVLDILLKEIKLYDTTKFALLKRYKNVGGCPNSFIISDCGKYLYIANKGANKGKSNGSISILELEGGELSYINMQKGSIIIELENCGNIIYALNSGLNHIDVIDIEARKAITKIKTTMPKLQRLKLIPEEHTLLATSTNSEGMGIIDRIDTLNNIIIDTYSFEQTYCQPYAIGVSLAESNKAMVVEREMILSDSEDKLIKKNSIDILARRVLSTYQEKVNFPQEGARLPAKNKGAFIFQNIYFEQCQMINTTKKRRVVIDRKDLSILQYEFYIPYYIELKDEGNKEYIVEGRLEGAQRASLFIPCYAEKRGVQFVASSFTNLSYLPYIIDNRLKFSASALIFTKAIIEEIVSIPNSKDILDDQVRIQRDEGE